MNEECLTARDEAEQSLSILVLGHRRDIASKYARTHVVLGSTPCTRTTTIGIRSILTNEIQTMVDPLSIVSHLWEIKGVVEKVGFSFVSVFPKQKHALIVIVASPQVKTNRNNLLELLGDLSNLVELLEGMRENTQGINVPGSPNSILLDLKRCVCHRVIR